MPSTVTDIFAAAALQPAGAVSWGTPVPLNEAGVYALALNEDPDSLSAALAMAPVAEERIEHLLAVRPELRLRGNRPSAEDLAFYFEFFWLPDEVVLYIGLAGTSVRQRVRQYYRTPLGAKRPHAGGWFLKTLSVLDDLWVHYAPTPDTETAEREMLRHFAHQTSGGTRVRLSYDKERPSPFANLRGYTGKSKNHGLRGATGNLP